jgi:dihydroorotate dehydrogenase
MLMLKVLTLEKISLLLKVQAARDEMQWGEEGPPPLLVKIAPDLSKEDLEDIAAVSMFRFMYFFLLSSSHICSITVYIYL